MMTYKKLTKKRRKKKSELKSKNFPSKKEEEKKYKDVNGTVFTQSELDSGKYSKFYRKQLGELILEYYPVLERDQMPKDSKDYLVVMTRNGGINPLVRLRAGNIIWCDQTRRWEHVNLTIKGILRSGEEGILFFDRYLTVPAFKSFEDYKNQSNQVYLQDLQTAKVLGYTPSKNSEHFVLYEKGNLKQKAAINKKRAYLQNFNTTHNADSDNPLVSEIKTYHRNFYKETEVDETIQFASELLGNLSFGVEFETSTGKLHQTFLPPTGLIPLIDGSLSSRDLYEYTTIPLEGEIGLTTLKAACRTLTNFCDIDSNCALHVHLGNLPKEKLFIISIWHLFERIQSELFEIVPEYKRNEVGIMGKNKNYSAQIRSMGIQKNTIFQHQNEDNKNAEIDLYYDEIFKFISGGQKYSEAYSHAKREAGEIPTPWRRQWECPTRYYAMNLVNYFFKRSGTVEFRMHGPTLSFDKTATWLFICAAIVRYAKTYPEKILNREYKINLEDIINEYRTNFGQFKLDTGRKAQYFNQFTEYLLSYIEDRKQYYLTQYFTAHQQAIREGSNKERMFRDITHTEFATDNKFKYRTKDLKELY
jgi:hypothetical protein